MLFLQIFIKRMINPHIFTLFNAFDNELLISCEKALQMKGFSETSVFIANKSTCKYSALRKSHGSQKFYNVSPFDRLVFYRQIAELCYYRHPRYSPPSSLACLELASHDELLRLDYCQFRLFSEGIANFRNYIIPKKGINRYFYELLGCRKN